MSLLVTVVSFLIVLSILVLVHELGHFAAGRWAKAKIEEFAIGFPPRVWSVRRGETDYSINAIPLGGYVRFAGEDDPGVSNGLSSLPRTKRAIVLLAGVTMNFLLAIALFTAMFIAGYPTAVPTGGVKVVSTVPGAPADQAGIKADDVVLSVNGQSLGDMAQFGSVVRSAAGQDLSLVVKSPDGVETTVQLVPRASPPPNEGPLGITIQTASVVVTRSYPPLEALQKGLQTTWDAIATTLSVPVMLVQGAVPVDQARPVGPIGISRYVGGAAEAIPTIGFAPILQLMALLSVSLAVVNILPLPGLDGGRLAFLVLEALRGGKRVSPQREGAIHFAGIMFFLGLMLIITFFDIVSPTPAIHWGP